jgi:hypothetical protein
VLGLLLAADANAQGRPCTPGNCTINVTVTACNRPGGISVDAPLVEVTQAVNMRWVIVPSRFAFAADGIQLDPPHPQFRVQNSPRPNEFRLHNAKTQAGDFHYFVNVEGCLPLDPVIRNR